MAAPPKLKAIQPFLKIANEYDKRDPVIGYYARMYAMQRAIRIDSKSPECKSFLLSLMDNLEKMKKSLVSEQNEAITNELVGCAHVEATALKVFSWADTSDRASKFNSGVVRAFYSANLLFDILKQFGTQSDEVAVKQKYAKWKATYINKCLQTGETPIPGPQGTEFEDELGGLDASAGAPSSLPYPAASGSPYYPPSVPPDTSSVQTPPPHSSNNPYPPSQPNMPSSSHPSSHGSPSVQHPSTPSQPAVKDTSSSSSSSYSSSSYTVPVDYTKATKLCKYAISALQYEDIDTAIDNLEQALSLLKSQR